ncbi:UrcA family protein [Qipengyuania sp. ASV99]|uniref:UrcA family protein n=1 Tax=Qipengyuania sp. ASV99 TaxID=3399681 RepID=UPI003A4C562E
MPIQFALAAALITVPTVVLASPINSTEFEATVPHEDLNLSTQQGVSRLDERVRTRIRQLCRNGGRDSASIRLERECRAGAFAAAERQVRFAIAKANADRARFAANSSADGSDTPGA